MDDNEDEVKERAFFYLDFIEKLEENGEDSKKQYYELPTIGDVDNIERYILDNINNIKDSSDYSCLDHNKIDIYAKENAPAVSKAIDRRLVEDYVETDYSTN